MEFARLPNELLLKIGYVCTLKSILSLRSVHRHFHDVFSDIFYGKFAIPASKAIGVACSANPATNAIERHWTSVLKRLLERGIDANTVVSHPLESKYSLLDVAVFQHRYLNATSKEDTEIFRLLLENGANANETEKDKYTQQARETQLHRAVKWGHKPMVEVLLEFGADVDALDKYRMSPLRETAEESGGSTGLKSTFTRSNTTGSKTTISIFYITTGINPTAASFFPECQPEQPHGAFNSKHSGKWRSKWWSKS
ncbi:Similar to Putative ankyrin repeat protein FPV230; acc. no. Q9J505 [Pyronema omphalodes CBS 100304]|uniref:Similar to Putative ankyrin repeat protein FPV230 acc. no. Q9J505 n=1 Tax=Pyronema omphalodes (strain CBS 100304) TaxID=1076935 RepID=U4LFF0_PYROM|nr:Similar to Putative ankyrin repeat protein FPV230; acc. no. Q9J505 [Pyronema omphalodes CBS 100304]